MVWGANKESCVQLKERRLGSQSCGGMAPMTCECCRGGIQALLQRADAGALVPVGTPHDCEVCRQKSVVEHMEPRSTLDTGVPQDPHPPTKRDLLGLVRVRGCLGCSDHGIVEAAGDEVT